MLVLYSQKAPVYSSRLLDKRVFSQQNASMDPQHEVGRLTTMWTGYQIIGYHITSGRLKLAA